MKVEITNLPEPEPPFTCWLGEPPVPPEDIPVLFDEDAIVRRVFVHIRQFNEALEWMRAAQSWMADLRICVETSR